MQSLQVRQAAAVPLCAPVARRPAAFARCSGAQITASIGAPRLLRSLKAVRAARPAQRRVDIVVAKAGGDVLVVGSSGQTAARVVVQLLRNGFKVTAGIDTDVDEAQEVIKFAKSLDLLTAGEAGALKLNAFNPFDADSIASALPRGGARVVVVVGDQAGSRKADARAYASVLDAIVENGGRVKQLVVVSPLAGSGSGTGFFGGRGGKGASTKLSMLEEKVVDSGLDYLIVRSASSDRVTDFYDANPIVQSFGNLPTNLSVSRSQVAEAVVQAMIQCRGDAIVEVGASPDVEYIPIADQVAAALEAAAEAAAEVEAEEEEEQAAPAKPAFGFFTRKGSKPAQQVEVEAVEEEEEGEAPAPTKQGGFFGFGTRKITRPAVKMEEVVEEEEEEEAPAPPKRGFGFGTIKLGASRRPAAQVEQEEEEEQAAPTPPKRGFSFGTRKVPNSRQQQQQQDDEEEEEPAPAPPKRGGFRFGTQRIRQQQQEQQAEEAAPTARRAAVAVKERPAAPAANAGTAKKRGGLLGFLGVASSEETFYADEQ